MKSNVLILFGLASLLFSPSALAQMVTEPWFAFDMGFGASSSPTATVQSVVGQGFTGTMSGEHTLVLSGFLVDTLFCYTVTSIPEEKEIPIEHALSQNYPNPFNPTTIIEYALPHGGWATLSAYNILGEEVATLLAGDHAPGNFRATWDASGLSSGVYFYRLTAGEYVQTKKMVLMR